MVVAGSVGFLMRREKEKRKKDTGSEGFVRDENRSQVIWRGSAWSYRRLTDNVIGHLIAVLDGPELC